MTSSKSFLQRKSWSRTCSRRKD